jgi:hypothetical protein
MKTFNFDPAVGEPCPLCNTMDIKEATLVPVAGTESGVNAKAIQVHIQCLREQLWYYPASKALIALPYELTEVLKKHSDKSTRQ